MNKPLLKILPGVAIMMISPSCSKDTDIIDEDNAALVAEQVIQKKVFYIKVKNASSLKKMGIEGLGTEGTKALKFEKGDKLKLKFVVKGDNSGTIEDETAFAEANCISTDGVFEVTNYWLNNSYAYAGDAIEVALQEMQDGVFDAAWKYDVQLLWGDEEILDSDEFKNNGYIGFKDQNEMFKVAPRSAEHSFTLTQNGYEYCLIVIEEGCNRIVKINDNVIYDGTSENTCFIVDPNSKVTVDGNDKNLSSGNLYYVKNNQD